MAIYNEDQRRIVKDLTEVYEKLKRLLSSSSLEFLGVAIDPDKNPLKDVILSNAFEFREQSEALVFDNIAKKIYISDKITKTEELNESAIQEVLRSLIDVTVDKHVTEDRSLENFGQGINEGLVEYIAHELQNSLNFRVKTPEDKQAFYNIAISIAEDYGSSIQLVSHAINADINIIINNIKDPALKEEIILFEINYTKLKQKLDSKPDEKIEVINEELKKSRLENTSLRIIDFKGERYIKFYDGVNFHLGRIPSYSVVEIDPLISRYFEARRRGAEISHQEFYNEIEKYLDKIELSATNEINKNDLTTDEMFRLAHARHNANENDYTLTASSMDGKFHIAIKDGEFNNKEDELIAIDSTDDGEVIVKSFMPEDKKEEVVEQYVVITEEKYRELVDRSANYQVLTEGELLAMYRYEQSILKKEEGDILILKPKTNPEKNYENRRNKYEGYASPLMAGLIVAITIIVGIATALVIYSMTT